MPEDLKLSQIGSSQLPPPFRGLHSPGFPEIVYCAYVLLLSKGGRGVVKVHKNLSECCANEGDTGTDGSA